MGAHWQLPMAQVRGQDEPMWRGSTGHREGDLHLEEPKDWFESECQRRIDLATRLLRDQLEEALRQRNEARTTGAAHAERAADLELEVEALKAEVQQETDLRSDALASLADSDQKLTASTTKVQVLQSQLTASMADADKLRKRVKELEDEYLGDFNKADLDGDGMLDRAEWIAMFGGDEMFDECDGDGSGKVDEAEWSKMMTPEARLERLRQKHTAEVDALETEHKRVTDGFEVILQRDVAAAQQAGENAVKKVKELLAETMLEHQKVVRALNDDHQQTCAAWEAIVDKEESAHAAVLKEMNEELGKLRVDMELLTTEHKDLHKWHQDEMERMRTELAAQTELVDKLEKQVGQLEEQGVHDEITIEQLTEQNNKQSAAVESVVTVVAQLIPQVDLCLEGGYGPPADAERPTSWVLDVNQVEKIREMDRFAKKVVGHAYELGDKVQAVVNAFEAARQCAIVC